MWPNAILHVDGDAFFVSVLQSVNPGLRGKPVVVGKERGICTAVSYEAKKYGVTRGMRPFEVRRMCPQCIILESDYRLYEVFSDKMMRILQSFSPVVEVYSIDEAFVDIHDACERKGITYLEMAQNVKKAIELNLEISVSVGVSTTKTLAKLASSAFKPSGCTVLPPDMISSFLKKQKVEDIWGVGRQLTHAFKAIGINTAYDVICREKNFFKTYFSKTQQELYYELKGIMQYPVSGEGKGEYKSMGDTRTFSNPTTDPDYIWSKFLHHVEQVFIRARAWHYSVRSIFLFIKTQQFIYHSTTIRLSPPVMYPYLIRKELRQAFKSVYKKNVLYRACGCYISDFSSSLPTQQGLFSNGPLEDKLKSLYKIYDQGKIAFGTSLLSQKTIKTHGEDTPFLVGMVK